MPVTVTFDGTFEGWRSAARAQLAAGRQPHDILWAEEGDSFLPGLTAEAPPDPAPEPAPSTTLSVPKEFLTIARRVACHRDESRWSLLYRILHRLTHGQPRLMDDDADEDIRRLSLLDGHIRRDVHKMHAFVRFRAVKRFEAEAAGGQDADPQYVAWYEPDHKILRLAAPFFAERFGKMDWVILTPDESAVWNGHSIEYFEGVSKSEAKVGGDDLEELWSTYYASIFNPARIKLKAMKKEMPVRFWKNLPEAQQVADLLSAAPARVEDMMARSAALAKADKYPGAEPFIPRGSNGRVSLTQMREAVVGCRGCPICENGTRAVFGEGPAKARIVFVGEQPGDQEEKQGHPFVGPSGQLLNQALEEAGLDRSLIYVTNAVKHFKFEPRGERRIHSKPNAREMQACKPWLTAELQVIKPAMIVALGATAAQSMLGPTFRITKSRGEVLADTEWAPWWMATYHPSALLRMPDPQAKERAWKEFVSDFRTVARALKKSLP